MNCYTPFDKLSIEEFDAIMELTTKETGGRIVVVDFWLDDHEPCIDVKFGTWKKAEVKCSFHHITLKQVAAFFHPESIRARQILRELFEGVYPK